MAVDVHVGGFASYDFSGELKPEYEDHINSTSKYGNNIKNTHEDLRYYNKRKAKTGCRYCFPLFLFLHSKYHFRRYAKTECIYK